MNDTHRPSPPIIYTWTDEAPALATHAFLPVVRAFASAASVPVETRDISLAGRILAVFPDVLGDEAVADDLAELGHMVEVESPVYGTYLRHGALQTFSDDQLTFGPWEPLGGHTRSILTELGYSEEAAEGLIESEVVEAWVPA